MGVSYYPEFNPPLLGLQPELGVCGKPIARAMPLLDVWASEMQVPELMSYYSESLDESFEHIGEPVPEGMDETPIEWFDPGEGLRTVRSLLGRLRLLGATTLHVKRESDRDDTVAVTDLIEDLGALESVLVNAQENGSKFRLRIDF